ncbi:hypothetical protein RCL1_001324 [Eukaryota sp. TZLM3-RCL]
MPTSPLYSVLDLLVDELSILCYKLSKPQKAALLSGNPSQIVAIISYCLSGFSELVLQHLSSLDLIPSSSLSEHLQIEKTFHILRTHFNYSPMLTVDQIFTYPCSTSLTFEKLLFLFILCKLLKRKHNELVLDNLQKNRNTDPQFLQAKIQAWKQIKPIQEYEREFREMYRKGLPSPQIKDKPIIQDDSVQVGKISHEYSPREASPLDVALLMQKISPRRPTPL